MKVRKVKRVGLKRTDDQPPRFVPAFEAEDGWWAYVYRFQNKERATFFIADVQKRGTVSTVDKGWWVRPEEMGFTPKADAPET